ncbi:hypothetical protein SDC9_133353 [bioreactor metagenome]|uniref:Uncharacterized protein n=1 Tax=bioreactor metagenome TaxID=1076179 RepID=A0A645DA89_9ZZZZ
MFFQHRQPFGLRSQPCTDIDRTLGGQATGVEEHDRKTILRPDTIGGTVEFFPRRTTATLKRQPVIRNIGVQEYRQANAFHFVDTTRTTRPFPRCRQSRKQHGGQNGDDGDYNQKFNQCK